MRLDRVMRAISLHINSKVDAETEADVISSLTLYSSLGVQDVVTQIEIQKLYPGGDNFS